MFSPRPKSSPSVFSSLSPHHPSTFCMAASTNNEATNVPLDQISDFRFERVLNQGKPYNTQMGKRMVSFI
jgi:hypothetical protein